MQGAPLAYTPFCDNNKDMDGFRFWKQGFWKDHLRGRPYHISALYVVDLARFRHALHAPCGLLSPVCTMCSQYTQPSWHDGTWELGAFLWVPHKGCSTASYDVSLHTHSMLALQCLLCNGIGRWQQEIS